MTETRRHDAIALAVLAAIVTLLFLDVLLGFTALYAGDVAYYYYPAKHVLREIVLGGEFPWWNPWFSAGQPLAANPEHEVFYPLTWLILLPDYRTGFHLLMWIHLQIAGWAMYALLRSLRLRAVAAFVGALSFAVGGICLSSLNLLPILFAVAWLPLTCLYTRRFLQGRSWRDFALASFFFGLEMLVGEPSTIVQTGMLLGIYGLFSGWRANRVRGAVAATALVGLISITALLAGAVQILPAAGHAADSVRSRGFSFEDASDWSMPVVRLGELVYPNLLGHPDPDGRRAYWGASLYGKRSSPFFSSIYPGLLLAVLALAGLLSRRGGSGLAGTVVAVSVLLALGAHTPLWRALYEAGLVSSLRYPEKFILMTVFAVIVFGARALHDLLGGDEAVRRQATRVAAVLATLALLAALLTETPFHPRLFAEVWKPSPSRLAAFLAASSLGWWMAFARTASVFLLVRKATSGRSVVWPGITTLFLLLDLGLLLPQIAPRIPAAYYETPALVRSFPEDRGPYRLFHHADWHKQRPQVAPYFTAHPDSSWVHRNSLFPMMPSRYGIRTVLETDYDLTALLPSTDFQQSVADLSDLRADWVDVAASMSNAWYRAVFIDPGEAFARAGGDRRILQPVGILPLQHYPRYYFAERVETITGRADFVRKLASGRFGKRTAFVNGPSSDPAPGRVLAFRETSSTATIDVDATGPSFLVISVTPHKHWHITVDGRETQAVVANVGYQGVAIPAGRHVVHMRYRNKLVMAGGALSLATLLALAVMARPPRVP